VRLLSPKPANAAQAIVECASRETANLSFTVGVEHLVLAAATLGGTLSEYGADAETVRDRIHMRERDAHEERLGGDVWSEQCGVPLSPEAKRMLELATRRRRYVTPDQMLATLIEHSPRARRLLFELDVPVGTLQDRLRR